MNSVTAAVSRLSLLYPETLRVVSRILSLPMMELPR